MNRRCRRRISGQNKGVIIFPGMLFQETADIVGLLIQFICNVCKRPILIMRLDIFQHREDQSLLILVRIILVDIFRNVILDPKDRICIIELDDKGENYRICWGLVNGGRPTSEKDEVFTRELWEMATECPIVFLSGIGVVGWIVPGGRDIAVVTSELMKQYDVAIWAHHGMFCSGEDFDLTFGLMHTVEKSAEILVKMLSMQVLSA